MFILADLHVAHILIFIFASITYCTWELHENNNIIMSVKGKRSSWGISEDFLIIKFAEERRETQRLNISLPEMRMKGIQKHKVTKRLSLRASKCQTSNLEQDLLIWSRSQMKNGCELSMTDVQNHGKTFIENSDSEASDGLRISITWCHNFLKRNGLTLKNQLKSPH